MAINMEEFIKKNREDYGRYEASGITHDFCPYDAIKSAADKVRDVEVVPADENGVNYTVRWNGKEITLGFLNRSEFTHELYAILTIVDAIKCIALNRGKEV